MSGAEREPRIVADSSTGRPVLIAPRRRDRPLHTTAGRDGADVCPFCPGAEAETPPEVDAIREPGTAKDRPGWRVRAFPNKFPAARWHEVIAEGAEHRMRPGDVAAAVWCDAFTLWRRRIAFMEAQEGVRSAFLFKNVGREAGASVAHCHSQLLGLPVLPPRLAIELEHVKRRGPLVLPELDDAEAEGRVAIAGERFVAVSPRRPRLPYETWLAPRDPEHAFEDPTHDGDFADVLRRLLRAVDVALGAPPLNTWLHRVGGEAFHWHFELQPRTGFIAGLELGGEVYINSFDPAECAARLREADAAARG